MDNNQNPNQGNNGNNNNNNNNNNNRGSRNFQTVLVLIISAIMVITIVSLMSNYVKNRTNIVLTYNPHYDGKGAKIVHSVLEFLAETENIVSMSSAPTS